MKVTVTKVGNRIHVRYPYSPSFSAQMEFSFGSKYSKRVKAHTLTLSLGNCRKLRSQFGDELEILPALREWAWTERKKHEKLELIRDGLMLDGALDGLDELAHELWLRITDRPYQVTGATFALTGGNVLLGDQPGLGKTYQALAAMVASKAKRILVIAPRTATRSVWESHIRELAPYINPVVAQGSRKERETSIAEFNIRAGSFSEMNTKHVAALIVNKEMIRVKRMWQCDVDPIFEGDNTEYAKPPGKRGGCPHENEHDHVARYYPEYPELFQEPWDYIIMDEAHHALASRYNVQSNNITQLRLGAMRLPLARKNGRKLAMSGTPYRSKAQKAWGTLNWLNPKEFGSFWKWAETHFAVTEGRYAREVSQTPQDAEQFKDMMRPYIIARTKQEVAPELPPVQRVDVWLDMDPAQAKAYESMRELAEANLHNGKLTAVGTLAELTRLRQFACSYGKMAAEHKMSPALPSNKYDWLLDFLREREGFGGKVIIASQFTGLLKLFYWKLIDDLPGSQPLMLTGETSDRQRKIFQERIQDPDDKAWIGLINMQAGGEAITLDQADDMVILDNPWISDVLEQMENRIHRISRIHQVTVYRLGSSDTIEQGISELTDQQRADLMALRPTGKQILADLFK